jgi:hypothetical protein
MSQEHPEDLFPVSFPYFIALYLMYISFSFRMNLSVSLSKFSSAARCFYLFNILGKSCFK